LIVLNLLFFVVKSSLLLFDVVFIVIKTFLFTFGLKGDFSPSFIEEIIFNICK
jgi:hypothetical protein